MAIGRGRRSFPPALSPSPALSASLVLAVAVMHILVVGCVVAGAMTSGSSMNEHGAHNGSSVMSSTTGSVVQHISASASDCVMGEHACVFVRADVVALVVAVGLILATAPLRTAIGTRPRDRAVVLGRPPPWAVLDHLQLSVIRR